MTLVWALATNDSYIFAGTYLGGVHRRLLSEVITSREAISLPGPSGFSLSQNYPNPFNPSTVIPYAVPVLSNVRLEVTDMLGRMAVELVNEEVEAGFHHATWVSNAANGVYFCRLEATAVGDPGRRFVEVKKIVLSK